MPGTVQIKLTRSVIGKPEKHRKIIESLGLRKLNQTVERPDSPSIRGMITAVSHMVSAEEK